MISLIARLRFINTAQKTQDIIHFLYFENFKIIKNYDIIHARRKATKIVHTLNKIKPFCFIATKHNARKGAIFERKKRNKHFKKVANSINHSSKVIYFGQNRAGNFKKPARYF